MTAWVLQGVDLPPYRSGERAGPARPDERAGPARTAERAVRYRDRP
ncbi:hypothetical protein Cus16_0119 [Curtobacterium sp. ER1/6]|nr:hypothetical protein Cus16_0119 [Curtobacterium sp. ER1/6]